MLSDCQKNWDAPNRDEALAEALRTNQRVWSILQSELVKEDNPLPIQIREDLLTLSVFIDNRIIQVMAHPEPEKLKILIDINLNLAAGLSKKPDKEEEPKIVPLPAAKKLAQTSIPA